MKKNKVLWTSTARKDLEEIIEYISKDSIQIAIEKYEKIKEAAQQLSLYSEQGRIIPELAEQNIRKYREIIISPWRLMYKVEGNIVYVMAVIDGRRNIEDILLNRQLR
jgi:toxin ParE1/3/4